MKNYQRIVALSSSTLLLTVGMMASAHAWGSATWELTPKGCSTGTVQRQSAYDFSGERATASTSESGNFCWGGNHPVGAGIHDAFGHNYANMFAPNYVFTHYFGAYDSRWGGAHSWGDAFRRT